MLTQHDYANTIWSAVQAEVEHGRYLTGRGLAVVIVFGESTPKTAA